MNEQNLEIISSKKKGNPIIKAVVLDWRSRLSFFFCTRTYVRSLTIFFFIVLLYYASNSASHYPDLSCAQDTF